MPNYSSEHKGAIFVSKNMVWGMLYTEYKTSRHSLQKPNIRTVLSNSEQCKSEEYLNNNSYICLDLLQALLHRVDRYKMNLLRWTPLASVCWVFLKDHITRTGPISGWLLIFHWMLVIRTSAQSNFAFSLESSWSINSRLIRLISLNCTGLWISYTDIVLDSKAVHKLGSWCFHEPEINASLELVGWRLVSFDVNWEQGYMFRRALWFQTKISIP